MIKVSKTSHQPLQYVTDSEKCSRATCSLWWWWGKLSLLARKISPPPTIQQWLVVDTRAMYAANEERQKSWYIVSTLWQKNYRKSATSIMKLTWESSETTKSWYHHSGSNLSLPGPIIYGLQINIWPCQRYHWHPSILVTTIWDTRVWLEARSGETWSKSNSPVAC